MAIETGLQILPVTIDGTADLLPKGSLMARRGSIKTTIHPPVSVSGLTYNDRDRVAEKVRDIIEGPMLREFGGRNERR